MNSHRVRRVLLFALVVATTACGRSSSASNAGGPAVTAPPVPGPSTTVTVHQFAPSAADPSVTDFDQTEIAESPPPAGADGLLFVFLPGTGGQPGCCTLLLGVAAQLGFHVIGLQYANSPAVGSRCLDNLDCYGMVRGNVFDGRTPGALSAVTKQDTVLQRLIAALHYLGARFPTEGWQQFLSNGAPAYPCIVFGGHSQGGGEADYISTLIGVRGVVALSSPPDTDSALTPAAWLTATGATAANRIVGFLHQGDPFEGRIRADWLAMGLGAFGAAFSVDGTSSFGGSHELISDTVLPSVVLATHDSTAVDAATPRCPNGSPLYAAVWSYMLAVAAGLPPPTVTQC